MKESESLIDKSVLRKMGVFQDKIKKVFIHKSDTLPPPMADLSFKPIPEPQITLNQTIMDQFPCVQRMVTDLRHEMGVGFVDAHNER